MGTPAINLAWLLPMAVSTVISLFAYLLRSTITDQIRELKSDAKESAKEQGRRIGELESWKLAHEMLHQTEERLGNDGR